LLIPAAKVVADYVDRDHKKIFVERVGLVADSLERLATIFNQSTVDPIHQIPNQLIV
jgi:hypothetical protein